MKGVAFPVKGSADHPLTLPVRRAKVVGDMRTFTAIVERDSATGLLVGHIPGFPGAHSQGETFEELQENLAEVVGMLLEDGDPLMEAEFVGTQLISVA